MVIRLAEERDIQLLKDIYNYEVENTTATFDLVPRTLEDRTEWFLEHKQGNSILIVTDIDGIAVGYASFSQYRTKDAYKSTVELSVYVNHNYRGMGIAKELIKTIIQMAKERDDIHSIISVITGGNDATQGWRLIFILVFFN